MAKSTMYKPFERKKHEETCNLFKMGDEING